MVEIYGLCYTAGMSNSPHDPLLNPDPMAPYRLDPDTVVAATVVAMGMNAVIVQLPTHIPNIAPCPGFWWWVLPLLALPLNS